jgi:hypothetical protein
MRTLRALSVIGLRLALSAHAVASFTTMASDGSSQTLFSPRAPGCRSSGTRRVMSERHLQGAASARAHPMPTTSRRLARHRGRATASRAAATR